VLHGPGVPPGVQVGVAEAITVAVGVGVGLAQPDKELISTLLIEVPWLLL
jgi:hypothetical protein